MTTAKDSPTSTSTPKEPVKGKGKRTLTTPDVTQLYLSMHATPPTAITYYPLFRQGVVIVGPDSVTPVNPAYCLTIPSTFGLMEILADLDPVMHMDDPQPFHADSPFVFTDQVPWLTFNNGALRNAGQLAIYWQSNNGDPGGLTAESNARLDIAFG